jgi:hypothetical protein
MTTIFSLQRPYYSSLPAVIINITTATRNGL